MMRQNIGELIVIHNFRLFFRTLQKPILIELLSFLFCKLDQNRFTRTIKWEFCYVYSFLDPLFYRTTEP